MEIEKYISSYLVYNALQLDLLKLEELLAYLQTVPTSDENLIAYRHALLTSPGDKHYCQGYHFLCQAPIEYGAIYAFSNQPPNLCTQPESDPVEAGSLYYKSIILMHNNPVLANKVMMITDQVNFPLHDDVSLIVKARSQQLLEKIAPKLHSCVFEIAQEVDWFDCIEEYYHPAYFNQVIDTYQKKVTNLPLYWERIRDKCRGFLEQIVSSYRYFPEKSIPEKIKALFPDFYPSFTRTFSEKAWFIYQLPPFLQGYVLGYPIHLKSPSRSELDLALLNLSLIGVEAYATEYAIKHKQLLTSQQGVILGFSGETCQLINENDTLDYEVATYSSFDVVTSDLGVKRYFFTRPEFGSLTEKGKNHWINVPLSFEDFSLISIRTTLERTWKLPPAIPLKELINKIDTYIPKLDGSSLYLEEPGKEDEDETLNVGIFTFPLAEFLGTQLIQMLATDS